MSTAAYLYAQAMAVTERARGRAEEERAWLDMLALLDAPAPAPSVVPETAVAGLDYTDIANRAQSATGRSIWPRTAEAVIAAALPLLTAAPSATRDDPLREALNAYRAEVDRAKGSSMSHALLMLAGATLANAVEAAITPREDR